MSDQMLDQLKRALSALQTLRQRYEALEARQREPIAVIGASCRFPGGGDNPQSFWRMLLQGVDAVRPAPPGRWPANHHQGGFLDVVDQFDAQFFGIAPREAQQMDPQQRLALELAWEAIEDAGWAADRLAGSSTGIFLGLMANDYGRMVAAAEPGDGDIYAGTGNDASFLAGRISYVLGLQGPSLVVSTSCSSSLVATHLAVQSLRRGECRMALAGGVSLMLLPDLFLLLSKMNALSKDGRCRSFDAAASGFGRGEGGGMLALKRLADAVADGDRVLAVIRGSAMNHDGRSNGLTAPNGAAQEMVLRVALQDAGIEPGQVGYLEAHGTGTALGDPIELQAAANVLGANRQGGAPLRLGTVKANIGHLEAAAGVASLLRAILVVHHHSFVPQVHFHEPNPKAVWDPALFHVPVTVEKWTEARRIAGVSSFGMSGTNAHAVVESWEPATRENHDTPEPLLLSARTAEALDQQVRRFSECLDSGERQCDIAYTAAVGRVAFEHRLVVSAGDWKSKLDTGRGVWRNRIKDRPKVAFLFTGQGSQYAGMARELYRDAREFREEIDRLGMARLLLEGTEEEIAHTRRQQPLICAVQYALTRLWKSWGVIPNVVLGHSVGEFAAAAAANVFTPDRAMELIAERASRMSALPDGGAMAAILARYDTVRQWLEPGAEIGADNAPQSVVVSGDAEAVDRVIERARRAGVTAQRLPVSHAFHSARMEPMLAEWERYASGFDGRARNAAWISTLTAERLTEANGRYWREQVRQPVRYRAAVERALADGCQVLLEIGPGSTLASLGKRCQGAEGKEWLTSLARGRGDREQMGESAARLWAAGVEVNWESYYAGRNCRRVALPTYPFERQRFWLDGPVPQTYKLHWVGQPLAGRASHPAADDLAVVNGKLDALCLEYAWRAVARWERDGHLPAPGQAPIAPQHRRLTALLYEWLAAAGAVERGSWHIIAPPLPCGVDPEALLREHPSFASYVRPLARCGVKLGAILDGEDPLPLLFPGGSLNQVEEIYEQNSYAAVMNAAVAEAVTALAAQTAGVVRILEVGAGTGGTTSSVAGKLDPSRTTYTFTDVSPIFLTRARQKFARHPQMQYRIYDLERDPVPQGFGEAGYDIVIAANVLHATSDVRRVLGNLRRLLAPGGHLVILELTTPQRMVDLTFGLLEGWWKFTDVDLRPHHPLLTPAQWSQTLFHVGFQSVTTHPKGNDSPQTVFVAANSAVPEAAAKAVLMLEPDAVQSMCLRVLEFIRAASAPVVVAWPQMDQSASGALRALMRCVAVEFPHLRPRWIEYSPGATLESELMEDGPEQEVRLTPMRSVTRLQRNAPSTGTWKPRADRSYLITGGTGMLGRSLQAWLLARGAGEVVSISRTGGADVADKDAVSRVLAGLKAPLGGVFHAAGSSTVKPLSEVTATDLRDMFAGKADGAQTLHELTANLPLDCFVFFSSAAAVWGSVRLGHYAAANGFLDGLAELRASQGLPALSLQFARMSERGMVPEQEDRHFDRIGLLPYPVDQAWDAMAHAIAAGETSCLLAEVDWNRFLPVFHAHGARLTLFEGIAATAKPEHRIIEQESWRDLAELSGTARAEGLANRLAVLTGRVLGFVPPSLPPIDRGLFELGMDSLTAVELKDRLSKALDVTLPPTLLYEQPTLEQLTGHLLHVAFGDAAQQASQPAVVNLLQHIESLSEEDVDRLFEERIASQGRV